jgi:hypothetical protein
LRNHPDIENLMTYGYIESEYIIDDITDPKETLKTQMDADLYNCLQSGVKPSVENMFNVYEERFYGAGYREDEAVNLIEEIMSGYEWEETE